MAHLFKEGKMASNHLDTYLAGVKLTAPVYDGTLVKLGNLIADTTYIAEGDYEYDAYEGTTGNATADAIVDLADISEGQIGGNTYKMGAKLHNLQAEAGKIVRARRLALHDKFWLGADNFTTEELTAKKIVVADYDIVVLVEKDLTVGTKSEGKMYLCEVCKKA